MRVRPSARLLLGLLVNAAFCCSGLAQAYLPQAITFSGSTLTQAELLAFTGLRAGEPMTRDQMQTATNKLTATGLFTDVRFSFDGQTLTFELKPSPAVVPVQYDNFPWWDDKVLNAAVAAQVPLFHGALYPGGPMRDQVSAALTALLATKGVQGATITTSAVGNESHDQVAIRYQIDSPPVVVESFRIHDYSGVWTRPLQALEKATAGQKIEGSMRDQLADLVRAVYGSQGFIDMTMMPPAFGQPHVADGKVLVPVTASITSEGGQYRVAGLHLEGDLFMSQEQFAENAKLHPGDVANLDVWKQIREMIAAPYRTHGYIDAKIDAVPVLDRAAHTVDYTITVQSGPVYHMGKLTVVNLNERQKAEVMPYWQLREGEAFNADLIPKFMADYHKSRAEQLQSIRGWSFDAKWSGNQDTHGVDVVLTFTPPQQ
ncbi:MAG: POTRA domain-containing protein [Acidobacteriaceae bacterium]